MSTLRTDNLQTTDSLVTIPVSELLTVSNSLSVVDSVASLLALNTATRTKAVVQGYYPNSTDGGGVFKWVATQAKSTHNGGTVISPTVPWNGSQTTLANFLNKVGETQPAGNGVWVMSRYGVTLSPKNFGALGDGVVGTTTGGTFTATDDQHAIRAAINTGARIDGGEAIYGLGRQIVLPENTRLKVKVLMLTGAGQFDASSTSTVYGANQTGFLGTGLNNVEIDIRAWLQPLVGVQRSAIPLALRNCKGEKVKGQAQFFQEVIAPIFTMDSCVGGKWDVIVTDCTTNLTSMASLQITAMGVDSNRVSGGGDTSGTTPTNNSINWEINGYFQNILQGAAARAQYTEQTDGLNVQSLGYSGGRFSIVADTIGEPCDLFGDSIVGNVVARNAWNYGVKLIHGASRNKITGSITNTGGPAVVFAGSTIPAAKNCEYNDVELTVAGVGTISNGFTNVACALTDGNVGDTWTPNYNTCRVTGTAGNASFVGRTKAGQGNTFICDVRGFSSRFSTNESTGFNRFKRSNGTFVKAVNTTTTSLSNGTAYPYNNITADRLGEYNSGTYTLPIPGTGRYRITAKARVASLPAGRYVELVILEDGTVRSRGLVTNTGTAAADAYPVVDYEFDINSGANVSVRFGTDNPSALTITTGLEHNSLTIEQV